MFLVRSTLFDLLNKFPSYTDFGKEIIPESFRKRRNLKVMFLMIIGRILELLVHFLNQI